MEQSTFQSVNFDKKITKNNILNRSMMINNNYIRNILLSNDIILQINKDKSKAIQNNEKKINCFLRNKKWNNNPNSHIKVIEICKECFENDEEMISFKKMLDSFQLSNTYCDETLKFNSIGPLHKYENDDKLKWRKVKGDGNCFYRAFFFSLLEQIIFTHNSNFLSVLIIDFKTKLNDKQMKTLSLKYNFDNEICLKCLLMIYLSMISKSKDNVLKSYTILIKMINNMSHFDYGLIAYYHILLYDYLKENEKNNYSEIFNVRLGNLLPSEYEDEKGNFSFDLFYNQFLFKLFAEAEKIIIYTSPFIFNCEINLYYDQSDDNEEQLLNFKAESNDCLFKVFLLYHRTHYDIIYTNEYFDKYSKYLCISFYQVIQDKTRNRCQLCDKDLDIYFINDNIIICKKCLVKDILNTLKMCYILLIQNHRKYFLKNYNEQDIKDLLFMDLNISNQHVDITIDECVDLLQRTDKQLTFDNLIYNIKCKYCVICDKPKIDNTKYLIKLPCDCRLCSTQCLNTIYLYIKSGFNLKDGIYCLCGKKYTKNDVKNLGKLLRDNGIKCDELKY